MSDTLLKPETARSGDPPGPKRAISWLNLREIRKDRLGFFHRMAHTYGPIVMVKAGPRRIYLVTEPDLIRDILVTNYDRFMKSRVLRMAKPLLGEGLLTSEGAFHKRQRRLCQPAFHKQRIAEYSRAMVEFSERTSSQWRDGATIDMDKEMMRLTLAIVAKTLFDANVDDEADEIGDSLTTVLMLFNRAISPFAALINKLPLPSNRRSAAARARMDTTVYRMIEERRKSGKDHGDLLSMLLAAQDEDDGSVMTDKQIRDEAMTLFLAGHETTANALTWTWYLLSEHPDVEKKLHEEIDKVVGDRSPSFEDVPNLVYTRKVFSESMRLYPPAYMIGRQVIDEYQLGPYCLPKNAIVLMSQFIMHRSPRFWDEPERFNPERWTPEVQENLPRFAYFPFGGGPRTCIGEGFAWMEGILVLATLARRWQARHVPGHPVALRPLVTLRPRYGMRMTLEERRHGRVPEESTSEVHVG